MNGSTLSIRPRLLSALGFILFLGGSGHFIGITHFYITQGVPDANRVLLDLWIGEAQVLGGGLYLAASRAVRSEGSWRLLCAFGALTIIGYAAPILPVLVSRSPLISRVPVLVYLVLSVWLLAGAVRSSTPVR